MKQVWYLVAILLVVLIGGCFNVFSPLFVDPKENDLSQIYDQSFLVEIGDYYANLGDYITAESFYSRVLEINPTNSKALIGLANCAIFSIVPRTNILSFYSNINDTFTRSSNYYDFIDAYVTNQSYYKATEKVSKNLALIISGGSDDKSLTNDDNLHFSFAIFNKIYSFFLVFDSNFDDEVSSNDVMYNFVKEIPKLSESNLNLPNTFLFVGSDIENAMKVYFREANKCIASLVFISNKLNSSSDSIEVKIYNTFREIDQQITNAYTNFYKYYDFYTSMYDKIVYLLTNNGIPLEIATNIDRLTNSLSISNYYNFDEKDITNIIITNDSEAWNILTNYLDLGILTNG